MICVFSGIHVLFLRTSKLKEAFGCSYFFSTLSDKKMSDKSDEVFWRWRKFCLTNNLVRQKISPTSFLYKILRNTQYSPLKPYVLIYFVLIKKKVYGPVIEKKFTNFPRSLFNIFPISTIKILREGPLAPLLAQVINETKESVFRYAR